MYPKKTLSAASLLSECERRRRRSLEARGCAKSESEFSMGTAATCPFPMSEQSPRSIKLHHQYIHEVTNNHYDKLKFPIYFVAARIIASATSLMVFLFAMLYCWMRRKASDSVSP